MRTSAKTGNQFFPVPPNDTSPLTGVVLNGRGGNGTHESKSFDKEPGLEALFPVQLLPMATERDSLRDAIASGDNVLVIDLLRKEYALCGRPREVYGTIWLPYRAFERIERQRKQEISDGKLQIQESSPEITMTSLPVFPNRVSVEALKLSGKLPSQTESSEFIIRGSQTRLCDRYIPKVDGQAWITLAQLTYFFATNTAVQSEYPSPRGAAKGIFEKFAAAQRSVIIRNWPGITKGTGGLRPLNYFLALHGYESLGARSDQIQFIQSLRVSRETEVFLMSPEVSVYASASKTRTRPTEDNNIWMTRQDFAVIRSAITRGCDRRPPANGPIFVDAYYIPSGRIFVEVSTFLGFLENKLKVGGVLSEESSALTALGANEKPFCVLRGPSGKHWIPCHSRRGLTHAIVGVKKTKKRDIDLTEPQQALEQAVRCIVGLMLCESEKESLMLQGAVDVGDTLYDDPNYAAEFAELRRQTEGGQPSEELQQSLRSHLTERLAGMVLVKRTWTGTRIVGAGKNNTGQVDCALQVALNAIQHAKIDLPPGLSYGRRAFCVEPLSEIPKGDPFELVDSDLAEA